MTIYEVEIGARIDDVAREMIRLANEKGDRVHANFNDFWLKADPGDKPEDVREPFDDWKLQPSKTEIRAGQIALKVLKYLMRKRGVTLSLQSNRELGNIAKAIEVPLSRLKKFAKPLIQEFVDECFADKRESKGQG